MLPLKRRLTRTEWEAYAAIKEAILSLKLEPGTPLLEDELVEQLNISKTPVRSALMHLERDGLVVRAPYKGTYVSEITAKDIREIVQLKAVLEGFAGRLATGTLTPDDLDQAERILDAADKALLAGNLTESSDLGTHFHEFIFERVSNQRLKSMLEMFQDQTRRLRLMATRTTGRTEKSAAEHRRILAALRQGDPDKVEAAFREHLHSFLDDVVSDLGQSRPGGNTR